MYRIESEPLALERLRLVSSDYDLNAIIRRIAELAARPDRARRLRGDLEPYCSAHAAGGRYRILFTVDEASSVVRIEFLGTRLPGDERDVYAEFRRLLSSSIT